jgi:hypothetical protein
MKQEQSLSACKGNHLLRDRFMTQNAFSSHQYGARHMTQYWIIKIAVLLFAINRAPQFEQCLLFKTGSKHPVEVIVKCLSIFLMNIIIMIVYVMYIKEI